MTRPLELSLGSAWGRWVIVGARTGNRWPCRCECGAERTILGTNLVRGLSRSCGCIAKDTPAHLVHGATIGHQATPEYKSWTAMRARCHKRYAINYGNYGGRGIGICERWASFSSFLADMGPKPSPAHTIDRINSDGNYEPTNCRWATPSEQARNRSTTRILKHEGKEQSVAAWSEETGVPLGTLIARLNRGWDVATALSKPVRPLRKGARKPLAPFLVEMLEEPSS